MRGIRWGAVGGLCLIVVIALFGSPAQARFTLGSNCTVGGGGSVCTVNHTFTAIGQDVDINFSSFGGEQITLNFVLPPGTTFLIERVGHGVVANGSTITVPGPAGVPNGFIIRVTLLTNTGAFPVTLSGNLSCSGGAGGTTGAGGGPSASTIANTADRNAADDTGANNGGAWWEGTDDDDIVDPPQGTNGLRNDIARLRALIARLKRQRRRAVSSARERKFRATRLRSDAGILESKIKPLEDSAAADRESGLSTLETAGYVADQARDALQDWKGSTSFSGALSSVRTSAVGRLGARLLVEAAESRFRDALRKEAEAQALRNRVQTLKSDADKADAERDAFQQRADQLQTRISEAEAELRRLLAIGGGGSSGGEISGGGGATSDIVQAQRGALRLSYSLARLRRQLAATSPDGRSGLSGIWGDRRFNLWVKSNVRFLDDNRAGVASSGFGMKLHLGASYRVKPWLTLGALLRYRHTSNERDTGLSSYRANAFGGSLFARFHLPQQFVVEGLVGYERAFARQDFSGANAGGSGTFHVDALSFSIRATRRWNLRGNWWIAPNATLGYSAGRRSAYTTTNGTRVPGGSFNQGTLSFGPTIGTTFERDPDRLIRSISPTLGVSGTWAFERPDPTVTTGGALIETPAWGATISAGLSMALRGGGALSFNTNIAGLGSDVRNYSFSIRFVLPLN